MYVVDHHRGVRTLALLAIDAALDREAVRVADVGLDPWPERRERIEALGARPLPVDRLQRAGGEGGVIAVDPAGNIAMDFNSVGMFRGARDSRGRRAIAMYRED